jgi:ABC-type phosphate transport system substrate-binding protein
MRKQRNQFAVLSILSIATWVFAAPVNSAIRADDAKTSAFRLIVHPSNLNSTTTREFVADVFFKRTTRWQGGEAIHPVDLRPEAIARRAFSNQLLQRSVAAVRSFWQQRIFSGRDLPPPELDSDEAVIKYVVNTPGAIGYVSSSAKVERAKELSVR